jgi:hypothetical protein
MIESKGTNTITDAMSKYQKHSRLRTSNQKPSLMTIAKSQIILVDLLYDELVDLGGVVGGIVLVVDGVVG